MAIARIGWLLPSWLSVIMGLIVLGYLVSYAFVES
jgi:hypothetical protein